MRKEVFILLGILFLLPLILAPPPFQTTTGADYLQILTPGWDGIKQGQNVNFYWHVFNTSTYLTNVTAECTFHLYSIKEEGEHLIAQADVVKFSNDRDFEVSVNGTNFTETGDYRYLIECKTPVGKVQSFQVGGIEGAFKITPDGLIQSEAQGFATFSYLFLMLFLTILFGWMGFKFSESDKLWVLGILFMFLSMLFVVYDVWLGYEYHKNYTGSIEPGMPETIFYIFMFILVSGLVISGVLLFTHWEKIAKRIKRELKDKQFSYEEDEIDRSFRD